MPSLSQASDFEFGVRQFETGSDNATIGISDIIAITKRRDSKLGLEGWSLGYWPCYRRRSFERDYAILNSRSYRVVYCVTDVFWWQEEEMTMPPNTY